MISSLIKTNARKGLSRRYRLLFVNQYLHRGLSDKADNDWDFLIQRSNLDSTHTESSRSFSNGQVKSEDAGVDNGINVDDIYATKISSESEVTTGDSFKPSKKRFSMDGSKPDISATKHEQAIFAEIFNSILKKPSQNSSNYQILNKTSKMSSGMQALFEKAFSNGPENTDPTRPNGENTESKDIRLGFTAQDIRKIPLSMTPTMQQPLQGALNVSQLFEMQTVIKRKFEPVIEYMNNLETDHQVVEFYKNNVLDEFPRQLEEKQNKATGSEENKIVSEIQEMEDQNVTIDKFPVDYHTLSYLLQETLRILYEDFDSPIEAITLFELTKSQSVNAYIAGCNSGVYNEILKIKWGAFKDLYLVESLISEMKVNGITPNTKTFETLGWISESAKNMKNSVLESGESATNLWTSDDEERLSNISMYRLKTMQKLYSQMQDVNSDKLMSSLMK